MERRTLLIVVVDDDYDTREFVSDVLSAEGYMVATWPSIMGAHQLIQDEQPDLVILDLQMPGDLQAGVRLFDQLQYDPETAPIPVILYSADQWAINRHAPMLQAAGGDVLSKPFELDTLYTMINRLTANHR